MKIYQRPVGRFLFLTSFFCLCLCSCGKKDEYGSAKSVLNVEDIDAACLVQAKNSDIPLPVGYDFVDFDHDVYDDTTIDFFCYQGTVSFDDVLHYYKTNMERLGWRINDLSNQKEGLLFCDKLQKTCVISIRNISLLSPYNLIYMFIKNRLEKEEGNIKDINSKDLSHI
jgi:hypothetical protein